MCFYVECFVEGIEQVGLGVEGDWVLCEGCYYVGGEVDVFGEGVECWFGFGWYLFWFQDCGVCYFNFCDWWV